MVSHSIWKRKSCAQGICVWISDEPKVKGIQLKSVVGIENDQKPQNPG